MTGPEDTPYHGGQYWSTLHLPPSYPFRPPAIYMHTPPGRFQPSARLCLSTLDFHPIDHTIASNIRTILNGLLSFMVGDEITTGAVSTTAAERRLLAAGSRWWNSTGGGSAVTVAAATAALVPVGLVDRTKFGDRGPWFRSEWPDLDGENWELMKAHKVDPLTGHSSVIPIESGGILPFKVGLEMVGSL